MQEIHITQEDKQAFKLMMLRRKRDKLLAQSDFTQLPDAALTKAQKQAWRTYRQALRDITKQVDLDSVKLP